MQLSLSLSHTNPFLSLVPKLLLSFRSLLSHLTHCSLIKLTRTHPHLSLLPLLVLESKICNFLSLSLSLSFSHDFSLGVAMTEPTEPSMSSSSPRDPTIGVHPRRELFEHNLLPISRKP
ncbi:hypothetical protein AAZX31_03G061100 [Glycine max]